MRRNCKYEHTSNFLASSLFLFTYIYIGSISNAPSALYELFQRSRIVNLLNKLTHSWHLRAETQMQRNVCWWDWSPSKINFKDHLKTACDRWLHTAELLIAFWNAASRGRYQNTKGLFLNVVWQNVLIVVLKQYVQFLIRGRIDATPS